MSRAGSPNAPTRVIADDYGSAVLYRRCSCCRSWKPQAIPDFSPRQRDRETRRVLKWDPYCRVCRNAKQRERYARLDAERRAEIARRAWQRTKERPDALAERRAVNAARQRAARAADPERARAIARRSYHRVMADPQRRAAAAEVKRMAYRLRIERTTGRHVSEVPSLAPLRRVADRGGRLPIRPLVPLVFAWLSTHSQTLDNGERDDGSALRAIGLDPRLWYAWRHGQRATAQFDTLDAILVGMGLHPWDVWRVEDDAEVHERAMALWGFDALAQAG